MRSLFRGASLLALTAATPCLAQTEPQAPEAEEEVIVTAQLRRQDPVDVPFALTAYNGEFLEDLGIDEFEELSDFVPGLLVQNQSPNNPGFNIRGITSDTGQAFAEPRVSVFQDGVPISKSRGSYVELFDLERVEIAKGPQSTLYGRSALIGAINLIQNKAVPGRLDAYARGAYGNFDSVLLEGGVNLPLSEAGGFRVAARWKERDGYVANLLGGEDFNSTDTFAARASLRLAPVSGLATLDVIANYQEDHPSGTSFKSLNFNPTDPATGAVIGDRGIRSGAALAPGAGFEGGRALGLDREVYGVTTIGAFELSDRLELASITAYRRFASLEIFDADGIGLPVLTAAEDARGDQLTQEFRLTYESEPVTAFLGASYFGEDGVQRVPTQFDERALLSRIAGRLSGPVPARPATDPLAAPLLANTAFTGALLQGVAAARGVTLPAAQAAAIAANLRSDLREQSTNFSDLDAFDVFADVTFRPAERFELGAGVRYSRDDKTTGFSSSVLNGRSILGGFIGALGLPAAQRAGLLAGLSAPGAAGIPTSAAFPVPLFGLGIQPTAGNGGRVEQSLEDEGFTFRGTARFIPTEDSSVYVTYARGRRPELLSVGAPAAPFASPRFAVIDAETVDSVEVGAKARFPALGLTLDGAGFHYQYQDFQTTEQEGTLFVTTNAGEADAIGFEGQFVYEPVEWARLFGTYAYNRARFETGAREGNRFRLSPDHSASLGARIEVPIAGLNIDVTPTVTYRSSLFFDDDNDRPELQANQIVPDLLRDERDGDLVLVNLRAGVSLLDDLLTIEGFVTNLTDERYIKDAGNTGDGIGLPTFIAGEPRFYGIQLSTRFGAGR